MPTPTKEKRLNIWIDRVERAAKKRKAYFKTIKKYKKFYDGEQWGDKKVTLKDKTTVNLIFAHIKSQIPFLYFQNPKWYVRPKGIHKAQFAENARLAEMMLNYYVEENLRISLKKQIRLAILDAFFAFGVIKTGYIADFETNKNFGQPKVLGEDEAGKPIYDVSESGEMIIDEEEEIVTNEAFYARRVSPAQMLFDPECENYFEDGRWIGQEIIKSYHDVKNSKLYKNTSTLEPSYFAKTGYPLDKTDGAYWEDGVPEVKEDVSRIKLYEVYDLEHDKLIVFAEGHDKFLRYEDIPDGIDGSPFSFLRFNESPDEMYPLSDIKSLKPIQEEYNVGRAMILTHAKRFARKYGYILEKFAGDDPGKEIEKLKDPEDGALFQVNELPLKGVIEPLNDAPLDSAVYANFEQTKQDFREVGGATEHERGLVERRKTAYEASKIAGAASIRKQDRGSLVEDFCSEIGTKLLQSMQANLTLGMVVEIVGEEGVKQWQTVSREDIVGEYNVGVTVGTSAPRTPEFEKRDLLELIQVLAQLPREVILPKINVGGLIQEMLKLYPLVDARAIINTPEEEQAMEQKIRMEQGE